MLRKTRTGLSRPLSAAPWRVHRLPAIVTNPSPWRAWLLHAVGAASVGALLLAWGYQQGVSSAGLDSDIVARAAEIKAQSERMQKENEQLRAEQHASAARREAEAAEREQLLSRIRDMETENLALQEDLALFDRLAPMNEGEISVRSFQSEKLEGQRLRYRIFLMQSGKTASEFTGRVQFVWHGEKAGQPWQADAQGEDARQALRFKQYRRLEGTLSIPKEPSADGTAPEVTSLEIRILDERSNLKVSQSIEI